MTDYTILYANQQSKLVEHVREYIAVGWTPLGGVAVAALSGLGGPGDTHTEWEYNQAMLFGAPK